MKELSEIFIDHAEAIEIYEKYLDTFEKCIIRKHPNWPTSVFGFVNDEQVFEIYNFRFNTFIYLDENFLFNQQCL